MTTPDEIGEQLSGWGVVARVETRGRSTGRAAVAAVGFVRDADGSLLVAAGEPDADWVRNLEAEPACVVTIEGRSTRMAATRLEGPEANRAIVALILRYGTPAERLGRGPAFRLRAVDLDPDEPQREDVIGGG